jgi:hypothetical protein
LPERFVTSVEKNFAAVGAAPQPVRQFAPAALFGKWWGSIRRRWRVGSRRSIRRHRASPAAIPTPTHALRLRLRRPRFAPGGADLCHRRPARRGPIPPAAAGCGVGAGAGVAPPRGRSGTGSAAAARKTRRRVGSVGKVGR